MEQISSLLAAAAVGGFAITAVAGKFMIPALHRLHFGQTIREEGPTWHSKKNGTPTIGRPLLYSGHSGHTGHRLGHVQP